MWGFWGAAASKWARPAYQDDDVIEHNPPAVNWGRAFYFAIFFAMMAVVKSGAQHFADWLVPMHH